jgi:uncharacterized membrane protein
VSTWSVFAWLRFLAGGVCHQIPSHSLQVGGVPLPLCARDTGTYLGLIMAMAAILALRRSRASLLPSRPLLAILAGFFLAWAADGANSYLALLGLAHAYEPSNALRLLTGTLEGIALLLLIWPVAAFTFWRQPDQRRVIRGRELAGLAAAAVLVTAVASQPWPLPRYVAGLLSGLGLVGMFALLNALLLAIALHREGSGEKPADVLRLLALALAPAVAELVLLSLLRHWLLG